MATPADRIRQALPPRARKPADNVRRDESLAGKCDAMMVQARYQLAAIAQDYQTRGRNHAGQSLTSQQRQDVRTIYEAFRAALRTADPAVDVPPFDDLPAEPAPTPEPDNEAER